MTITDTRRKIGINGRQIMKEDIQRIPAISRMAWIGASDINTGIHMEDMTEKGGISIGIWMGGIGTLERKIRKGLMLVLGVNHYQMKVRNIKGKKVGNLIEEVMIEVIEDMVAQDMRKIGMKEETDSKMKEGIDMTVLTIVIVILVADLVPDTETEIHTEEEIPETPETFENHQETRETGNIVRINTEVQINQWVSIINPQDSERNMVHYQRGQTMKSSSETRT